LNVWDTSGHPEFYRDRLGFYKGADAVIFMFDVTLKKSYEGLDEWLRELEGSGEDPTARYLVGMKADGLHAVPADLAHSYC